MRGQLLLGLIVAGPTFKVYSVKERNSEKLILDVVIRENRCVFGIATCFKIEFRCLDR